MEKAEDCLLKLFDPNKDYFKDTFSQLHKMHLLLLIQPEVEAFPALQAVFPELVQISM